MIGGVSIGILEKLLGQMSMVCAAAGKAAAGLDAAPLALLATTTRKPLSALDGELSTPLRVTEGKNRISGAGVIVTCPPCTPIAPACTAARQIEEP